MLTHNLISHYARSYLGGYRFKRVHLQRSTCRLNQNGFDAEAESGHDSIAGAAEGAFRDDAKRQFPAKLQPEDVPFHSRITDLTDA